MKKRKKRSVTLIEIMIVILLIGLIGGALAFNMRGSMDKGKIFKTEQNINRVYDILMMEYSKGESSLETIVQNREAILRSSFLVKNGEKFLKDGWGNLLNVKVENDDLVITSIKLPNARNENAN